MKRVVLGLGLLTALLVGSVVSAESAQAETPWCIGGNATKRAQIKSAMRTAIARDNDRSKLRIALHDGNSGVSCGYQSGSRIYTRSVIKVALSGALLRERQKHRRQPSAKEFSLMHRAITRSDNDAAQDIYNLVGRDKLRSFFRAVGVANVQIPTDGHWGNTRMSATSHIQLLSALTNGSGRGLAVPSKDYLIDQMHRVVGSQRWGVGEGAAAGAFIAVKNGWGPGKGKSGFIVNTIGVVRPSSGQYEMAILTNENGSEKRGMKRVGKVARVLNAVL